MNREQISFTFCESPPPNCRVVDAPFLMIVRVSLQYWSLDSFVVRFWPSRKLCNVIFTRGAQWRRMKRLQCISGTCLTARLLQSKLSTFPTQLVLVGLYAKVVGYKQSYEHLGQPNTVMYSRTSFVRPPFLEKNSCHTLLQHAQSQVRFPPMLVHTSASTWVLMTRLPCWLPRGQQVSHQMRIWGNDYTQAMKLASKGSIVSLKPRADVTRSPKQG